jgi:lysophospholipase L1-like esterase
MKHPARFGGRIVTLSLFFAALLWPCLSRAALGKLGAMGDSLSDEYWDSGVSSFATNWPGLFVMFRGIDMGPTAAQAGTNSWGSPRNVGYKYNWALTGANSATLLSEGQHTGVRGQVLSEGLQDAVLEIGANDFNPNWFAGYRTYYNIYNGTLSSAQIQSNVNWTLTNIEIALAAVRTSGVSVVMANVLDPGATPAAVVTLGYSNPAYRDRVATVIQTVNAGLKNLAQKYQTPLMDWYGLEKAILGPNTSLHPTLKLGNVNLNLRGSDSGSTPTNAFVSDGFHPNTPMQGIFANLILQALNSSRGAGLALFTEQEILGFSHIPYGGADTLYSQIGAYTNYLLLPTLPLFTSIAVFGTNVALTFSTVSNQFYIVESRDDLFTGNWATVTNNVPGGGGFAAVTNRVSAAISQRFYRVRQLP